MFPLVKYSFEIEKTESDIIDKLKNEIVGIKYFDTQNTFGEKTKYFGELNLNEFVLTRCENSFGRINIFPDAHIKLQKNDNCKTNVKVQIKLSDVWYLTLILFHLALILSVLFIKNLKAFGFQIAGFWFYRILLGIMTLAIIDFIVWLTFLMQVENYKRVIQKIFFSGIDNV